MGGFTKEELLAHFSTLAVEKVTKLSREEMVAFEKENPNELITGEIQTLVEQRALSELLLHLNDFVVSAEDMDEQQLKDHFETWFAENEEQRFRVLCKNAARDEIAKRSKPEDKDMTFSDKFRRMVRENNNGKNGSISGMLNSLK